MNHKEIIEAIHENHDYWIREVSSDDIPLLRKYVIRLIHQVNMKHNASKQPIDIETLGLTEEEVVEIFEEFIENVNELAEIDDDEEYKVVIA